MRPDGTDQRFLAPVSSANFVSVTPRQQLGHVLERPGRPVVALARGERRRCARARRGEPRFEPWSRPMANGRWA